MDFSELVVDDTCVKCDRKLFDKSVLLSHMGVKHNFLNDILKTRNLTELQLLDLDDQVRIKKENGNPERTCEICCKDFSNTPQSQRSQGS